MQRRARDRNRQSGEAIARVARAVIGQRDLDGLLGTVLDEIVAAAQAHGASVYLADEVRQVLQLAGQRNLPPELARQNAWLRFEAPVPAARAATTRQVQVVEDLSARPAIAPEREALAVVGAGSLLAAPLLADGRLVGVLECRYAEPHRFTPTELATIRAIADVFAAGIVHAQADEAARRLRAQAGETEQRLRAQMDSISYAILAIADSLASLRDRHPQPVLQTIADQARLVAAAEYAALGIGTDPTCPFEQWAVSGVPEAEVIAIGRFPRPVGTLGLVAHDGRTIRVPDIRRHPAFIGLPPEHPTITSFLGVPIRYRGRSLGDLYLGNKLGGAEFTAEDQRAIELLAAHAGIAVEQARLRAEVEAERGRFETIFASAAHGIVFVEAETGRLMANQKAIQLFGRAPAPEAGRAQLVGWICHPDGRPLMLEEMPSSRALDGQTVQEQEFVIVRPDGRRIPVLASAAPVLGPGGEVAGAVVVFQDIAPFKELERLREEWTSVVARDLRQPATVIADCVRLLQCLVEQHAGPEEEARAVDRLAAAAGSLSAMIADLLDAAGIEARRLQLDRRPVDLAGLVPAAVKRTADLTRGHPVRVDVHAGLPSVSADPGRIEQVLRNLLSNAAKYSFPETEIAVGVERRDGEVAVSVSNQGVGIPPEELSRLFTRFHRKPRARAGEAVDLGLGLYIARGLVEAHGGRLWVESIPGQTTTFHFTLPVVAPGD